MLRGEDRGRLVKTTGDGMLVEFSNTVDIVCWLGWRPRRLAQRAKSPERT
jgi:class 3 adenylate cyclase